MAEPQPCGMDVIQRIVLANSEHGITSYDYQVLCSVRDHTKIIESDDMEHLVKYTRRAKLKSMSCICSDMITDQGLDITSLFIDTKTTDSTRCKRMRDLFKLANIESPLLIDTARLKVGGTGDDYEITATFYNVILEKNDSVCWLYYCT